MVQTQPDLDFSRRYRVVYYSSGARKLYVLGKGYSYYLPPPDKLKAQITQELIRFGRILPPTKDSLKKYGLLYSEKPSRSVESGARALGIPNPVKSRKEVFLARADRHFRGTWSKKTVRKFLRNPIGNPIPTINLFKHKYPQDYKWIKVHGGMSQFMEERHPGLYYRLTRRQNKYSIDIDSLRKDLYGLYNSGVPITRKFLLHSRNRFHKSIANKVIYLVSKRVFDINQNTFNEVVSLVLGINRTELEGTTNGARECGRLAGKFVKTYLLWASKLNKDPLSLGISTPLDVRIHPTEISFRYIDGTKEKSGWADSRIKNSPVEVKTSTSKMSPLDVEELKLKYFSDNFWKDGYQMQSPILFLHQNPEFYSRYLPELTCKGGRVIGREDFCKAFGVIIKEINLNIPSLFQNLNPKLNESALTEVQRSLSLERRLAVLSRPGMRTYREWCFNMLDELIEAGESL